MFPIASLSSQARAPNSPGILCSRRMQEMAPHRAKNYTDTYSLFRHKADQQDLINARALSKTLSAEADAAAQRVLLAEAWVQSLRDEAQVARIRFEEAEENIGYIREYIRRQHYFEILPQAAPAPEFQFTPPNDSTAAPSSASSGDDDGTSIGGGVEMQSKPDDNHVNGSDGTSVGASPTTQLTKDALAQLEESHHTRTRRSRYYSSLGRSMYDQLPLSLPVGSCSFRCDSRF